METTYTKKPVYKMTTEKKDQFVGILLLDYLINQNGTLPILMDGGFKVLDSVTVKMVGKGYLQVSGSVFRPTTKGQDVLKSFMQRYYEYLKIYDVYCAVDTATGEFAFSKYYDMSEEDFRKYVCQSRFEDVRIAVAEFKGLDPMEIVFMSFINEGRFNTVDKGWQFDVYTGLAWTEIEKICNGSLSVSELNGDYPEVTQNIITEGAKVAVELLKIEDQRRKEDEELAARETANQNQQYVEETVVEETITEYNPDYYCRNYFYYECYYDPFYISPIWILPLLLI